MPQMVECPEGFDGQPRPSLDVGGRPKIASQAAAETFAAVVDLDQSLLAVIATRGLLRLSRDRGICRWYSTWSKDHEHILPRPTSMAIELGEALSESMLKGQRLWKAKAAKGATLLFQISQRAELPIRSRCLSRDFDPLIFS